MKIKTFTSIILFINFLFIALVCNAAAEDQSEIASLHKIFDDEWEWGLKQDPFIATYTGDPRFANELPDRSLDAIETRRKHAYDVKARLEAIKYESLPASEKLNFDLFNLNSNLDIEGQKFRDEFMPINQMGGVHSEIAMMAKMHPKQSVENIEDLISRLSKFPALIDQTISLMKQGMAKGLMPPKVVLADVANQIQAQITDDVQQSPIFQASFSELPSAISQDDQQRLRNKGAKVISTVVIPAIRNLYDFWVKEYLPQSRSSIGLSELPNGNAWYKHSIKVMTTTDLTADEIHKIGLAEVKRIRVEMQKVKNTSGFKGDLKAFFEFLREDKQFFYTEELELLAGYRDIAKRIDPELTKLFGKLPRVPYGVIPVPAYEAKTQTTAYYNGGSLKAGRPGYFYANTYALSSRPKWEMEALTLHEAVPGHHLQISLSQEIEEVPDFRRFGGYTAFVEGWGLYAESLGEELGLYKDPYSKFGQLTYEMWRAIRLVVDTGMHAKDWTRQQAIDFFVENTGKTLHDITVEVDRYIVWPGQALAYKLGELKFKELRAYAKLELKDKFNIREFHDQALGEGSIPLSVLESKIKNWVNNYK